jgi:hypothetical protein
MNMGRAGERPAPSAIAQNSACSNLLVVHTKCEVKQSGNCVVDGSSEMVVFRHVVPPCCSLRKGRNCRDVALWLSMTLLAFVGRCSCWGGWRSPLLLEDRSEAPLLLTDFLADALLIDCSPPEFYRAIGARSKREVIFCSSVAGGSTGVLPAVHR